MNRVAVTGMGVVSCLGNDVDTYWKNLLAGKSGISKITDYDTTNHTSKISGKVRDFDPDKYMEAKFYKRLPDFIRFALGAAVQAKEQAAIPEGTYETKRCGVVVGSGVGGMGITYDNAIAHHEKGARRVSPFFIPLIITNMAAGQIGQLFGYMGPNFSISTACATANHSLIQAADIIRMGRADMMVAGGTESALESICTGGFCNMKAMSTAHNDEPEKASRPFSIDRDGFVIAEGAGIVILENLESAQKRGATIYAEICGGGMSCDAYHMSAPREDGLGVQATLEMAIKDAGIDKTQINYINTHGTSTPLGDVAEVSAIKNFFGDHAYKLKINSTKSMIGHTLGAAGGLEGIATIMSIVDSKVHPTINLNNPDPACDLDFVPNKAEDFEINYALSNSFGFGGHNASVLFGKVK